MLLNKTQIQTQKSFLDRLFCKSILFFFYTGCLKNAKISVGVPL